ncbi:hypothetical protein ACFWXK_31680 [Streptomyces sp. NPDC059070]|uniref:hypothetical protein n=1 Tax=Streptomyces sp. NPDC059070 TaxID=3346713 RepID=UPI0036B4E76A
MSEHLSPEDAEQLIQVVSTWYAQQLMTERRAALPDPERMAALQEAMAACAADRRALRDAGPRERAEIVARYAARARELDAG